MEQRPFKMPLQSRTFELFVRVSRRLEGGFKDWPPEVQDAIAAALERKAVSAGIPLAIVHASCGLDFDDKPYVTVIARQVTPMEPEIGREQQRDGTSH